MNILYPPSYNVTFLGNNPAYRELWFGDPALAPHALTDRDSYTFVAGRRGIITNIFAYIRRVTVAAPVGLCEALFTVNYGIGQHSVARLSTLNNVVGTPLYINVPASIYVPSGGVIFLTTIDLSTGGTNYWLMHLAFVEVDG